MRSYSKSILGVLLLAGCSSIGDYYRVDPIPLKPALGETLEKDLIAALEKCTAGICNDRLKSSIAYSLIGLSDNQCAQHKSAILGNSDAFNAGSALTALLSSTAGALVTSSNTAKVLSGFAAAATGTRAIGNDEVYEKMLVPTILEAIDDSRRTALNRIEFNLQTRVAEYGVQEIVRDAIAYHERCSFTEGLQHLAKALERRDACDAARLRELDLATKLKEARATRIATGGDDDFLEKIYRSDLSTLRRENGDCF